MRHADRPEHTPATTTATKPAERVNAAVQILRVVPEVEQDLRTPRLNILAITDSKGSTAKPEFHVRQDWLDISAVSAYWRGGQPCPQLK